MSTASQLRRPVMPSSQHADEKEQKPSQPKKVEFSLTMNEHMQQLFHTYYEPYSNETPDSVRWLEDNHYIVRKSEEKQGALSQKTKDNILLEKNWRYTLWSGGTIFLPKDKRRDLFEVIADDIANGRKVYFNERAFVHEGMRFVVDVDSKRLLSKDEILVLCQYAYDVLASYYTQFASNPIPLFYSVSGPRLKSGILCTSLHLIAHVAVTVAEARQLTRMILYKLQNDDNFDLTEIVLDDQIYKDNSCCHLRMIYSSKRDTCPVCLNVNTRNSECKYCKATGFVVSKFPYIPRGAIANRQRSKELFDKYHKSWFDMLMTHSLTVNDPSEWRSDYLKPPSDPVYQALDDMMVPPKNPVPGRLIEHNATVRYCAGKGDIPQSVINHLSQFIQKLSWIDDTGKMIMPWKEIQVMEVKKANNRGIALINFYRTVGASFCCYVNRDHSSNRIYMLLSSKGVLTVRCHSKQCQNLESWRKFENVPRRLVDEIFGVPTKDRMPSLQLNLARPQP